MYSPSSSSVTDERSSMRATTSPRQSTIARRHRARISARSLETSRTALPSTESASIRSWIVRTAPTSTPRVGWSAIRTDQQASISRPQTTFCMFPPDSWRIFSPSASKRTP